MGERKTSSRSRRDFLKEGAGAAAGLSLLPRVGRSRSERPNVVLMIADNLGWRDLGCYGEENVSTPCLDRMASEGVKFSNAFVTAPSCSPSRATFISGQSPHSVNVLGLTHLYPQYQMPLSVDTMVECLKREGYNTGINGKWHVSPYVPVSLYGYQDHMGMFSIKDADKAKNFISEHRDRPFYLEMNFMQTHRPAMPGAHAYEQHPDFPVDPDKVHVPDYWGLPDWPAIRKDVAAYFSQAAYMDHIIGNVMDHLDKEGIGDNTLVIFVSDNGPMYPGGIGFCYDFGIGTPLIMRWPAGLPAGREMDGLVSTIDIMPTALSAAGAPVPDAVQGKSLLAAGRGETENVHDQIFAEMTYHVRYTPMRAVRTRDYKYILNLNDEPVGLDMCKDFDWAVKAAKLPRGRGLDPRPPEELYDLRKDPTEKNNLADSPELTDTRKELRTKVETWRQKTGDPLLVDKK
ncbi:MAG: sulfatase-like hydrolase/transferase [bacterium]